ncbi:MAG: arginine--tRNA ligase [Bacteroidota bacterium]|nr:arginine--tRNA ligase [Bacteroidota bacterium]
MKNYLSERISAAIAKAGLPPADGPVPFEKPRSPEHGDLSTTIALLLSRRARMAPRKIAEAIVAALEVGEDYIAGYEVAGPGFINFRYSHAYLGRTLLAVLDEGEHFGRTDVHKGKRVNVEWVSANPTGPLHAGHGRQVCLGATLSAMLEWTGWDVTREYYFNNAGNQMTALGLSVRARYLEKIGFRIEESEIQYVGGYIGEIAEEIFKEFGNAKKDAAIDFFRLRGEQWCFASIKRTLDALGVHHDVFFNEDSLYKDGSIEEVIREFRERGLAYDKDGAVWFRATAFGADKDRVLVKATGEPTYRLPDIAYHRKKILRGYDKIIDIFGADHIATFPDVIAGVSALGLPADRIDVIIHQMVSFVDGGEAVRMSKRAGNVYYLDDLIRDVGADAVRYFFIMRSANSHLEFDIRLAREQSENNPVYYLQYAHARIASILRFAQSEGMSLEAAPDVSLLRRPEEIALMKTILEFPETVLFCADSYEVHHLCTYLQALAAQFHKFYHECRVVTDDKRLSHARLALCLATKQVLANGLRLLGINAPERM